MFYCCRLILVALALSAAEGIAIAQTRVPDAVFDEIARAGSASVIVGVRAAVGPEGRLSSGEVAQQHVAIRAAVDAVLSAVGSAIEVRHRYQTIPFFSARVDAAGLTALSGTADVLTIEPDTPEPPTLVESVPLINAPAAHSAGATGAGWKVAVLDTGVQTSHPFFGGRIYAEACYSNGAGGGMSVCPGGVNSTAPGSGAPCPISGCNHGTHVAGISLGANASFTGVAPAAELIAIQVFTNIGGSASSYPSDQVLGMERVIALAGPNNANQIAAVNLSLGGAAYSDQTSCDAASPSRKAAIDNLRSLGIATVVSSGNNGYTGRTLIPSCISSAISVGNTTKSDVVANSSNRAPFLALLAPGTSIYSSIPDSAFGFMSGTSMAAPHVTGAWGMLKQVRPAASVTQILDALRSTGAAISDPASDGEAPQAIYPRINVGGARLALIGPIAPSPPTVISATENAGTLTVTWVSGSGGAPTSHRLDFYAAGALVLSVNAGAATSAAVPIPPGTVGSFAVQVVAANSVGSSPPSALFPFTIGTGVPGPPTITTAVASGGFLNLAWMPGPGPTPTSYRLDFYSGAILVAYVTVGASATTAIPIPPGVAGTFGARLTAFNGAIAGPTSSQVEFTIGPVCTVPAAPILSGGVVGETATASWPPVPGAITYLLSVGTTPGGTEYVPQTNIGSITTVSASGLPPAFSAWVRVIAVNACGQQGPPTDFLVQ